MIFSIIGWLSTFLAFSAYFGVSIGKLKNTSFLLLFLNLIASIGFVIQGYSISNYSAVVQNIFFVTFSLFGILKIYIKIKSFNLNLLLISILSIFIFSFLFYYQKSNDWIFFVIGWPCVVSIVGAFILYSQLKINTKIYFLINIIANVVFTIHLVHFHNYQFAALQILSFFMGIYGILINSKITEPLEPVEVFIKNK